MTEPTVTAAAPPDLGPPENRRQALSRARISRSAIVVVVVGLIITGVLSWVSYVQHDRTEQRLLTLQTRVAGALLQTVEPTIETPIASAAQIASTNGGDPGLFQSYMQSYVGPPPPPGKPGPLFVAAQLWRIDGSGAHLLASAGWKPALSDAAHYRTRFLAGAAHTTGMVLTDPLAERTAHPRLGYAVGMASGASTTYVVYAESGLPPHRTAPTDPNSPLADLRAALYLGDAAKPSMLLEASAGALPLRGRTADVTVPFGQNNSLYLVASSPVNLSGTLSTWLWWLVAIVGVLVTAFAALAVERLVRRRRRAEQLTGDVSALLGEQRSIAETLQRALLPSTLPELPGIDAAARYLPGVSGVEIGGDWYDLIRLSDDRFFFVVGDVSGRGVEAGAIMASLQFAIRAFVSEGYPPEKVLERLARLLELDRDKHFATVLCGVGDVARHEITIANAGHPPPVLVADHSGAPVRSSVGPPIGISTTAVYEPRTVPVPPGATLLAYTDGLIERRDEDLAVSMRRLNEVAAQPAADLNQLLDRLVGSFAVQAPDDTALLGLRWRV